MKQLITLGICLFIISCSGFLFAQNNNSTFQIKFDSENQTEVFIPSEKITQQKLVPIKPKSLKSEPQYNSKLPVRYAEIQIGSSKLPIAFDQIPKIEGLQLLLYIDTNADGDLQKEQAQVLKSVPKAATYFETAPISLQYFTPGNKKPSSIWLEFLLQQVSPEEMNLRHRVVGRWLGQLVLENHRERQFLIYDLDANGILNQADVMIIDQNFDGILDGQRNSVECYQLFEPFLLENEAFQVTNVDPEDTQITVSTYSGDVTPRIAIIPGSEAPDFVLNLLEKSFYGEFKLDILEKESIKIPNHIQNLTGFLNQPVVLCFFASWCQYCQKELPDLVKFLADPALKQVKLIAVSYDQEERELIKFLQENKFEFPVFLDDREKGISGPLYQVGGLPTTFFISREGKVLEKRVGYSAEDAKELEKQLKHFFQE